MDSPVSAIIFDLGGVILNLNYHLTIEAFQKSTSVAFDTLYTQANQTEVFSAFETGQISNELFRKRVCEELKVNLSDEEFDNAWNAMLLDLPIERIELIQKLRSNYRVFLFSNTNAIHLKAFQQIIKEQHGRSDLLETVFEKTYYSHLIHLRKPDTEAFQFILNEQELNPKQTLFVDDSIQHIEGAKKIGIQTIHLGNGNLIKECQFLLNH